MSEMKIGGVNPKTMSSVTQVRSEKSKLTSAVDDKKDIKDEAIQDNVVVSEESKREVRSDSKGNDGTIGVLLGEGAMFLLGLYVLKAVDPIVGAGIMTGALLGAGLALLEKARKG